MSGMFSGTITAGLLATIAVVAAAGHDGGAPASDRIASSADKIYRLQIGGDAQSCLVERGDVDMRGSASLKLNPACEERYPRLSGASLWSQAADGSVAFMRDNGSVLMEFSVADGAAYQSFKPGSPLAALIALN